MKINLTNGVGIETNSNSDKKIKMKINPDMGMALVTKYLYSNPIQTLTQEYLCNARDASRSTGSEEPIEVTFPTKIEPILRIRDFGPGISDDLMENVFCILGESEKRNSSELTGGFGIGAKSAWAYTDSFIIKSFINGEVSVYLAHIGENQGGVVELISKESTNERNGVEIQINVKEEDIDLFKKAFYRATFFWDIKPILKGILSEEVDETWSKERDVLVRNKNFEIIKSNDIPSYLNIASNRLILVIDKIPYKGGVFHSLDIFKKLLSYDKETLLNTGVSLIVYLNNNDLDISASREEINNNDFSKEEISKILEKVFLDIKTYLDELRKEPKNVVELISLYKKEKTFLAGTLYKDVVYNNVIFQIDTLGFLSIINQLDNRKVYFDNYFSKGSGYRKVLSKKANDEISVFEYKVFYNDENSSDFSIRKKVKYFLNKNSHIKKVYVLKNETNKEIVNTLREYLKIENLSELNIPEKEQTNKERAKKDNSVISINQIVVNNYSHSFNEVTKKVKIDDFNNEKIVYLDDKLKSLEFPISLKNEKIYRDDLISLFSFLTYKNYKILSLSERARNKIKSKQIFSLEQILEKRDWSFTKEDTSNMETFYLKDIRVPSWIIKMNEENILKRIYDKRIENILNYLKRPTIKQLYYCSNFLLKTYFGDLNKDYLNENTLIKKYIEEVNVNYSLISKVNTTSFSELAQNMDEVIFYINEKYKSQNG